MTMIIDGGNNYMIEYFVKSDEKCKEIKILDDEYFNIDGVEKKYSLIEIGESKYLLKIENKFYEATLQSNHNGMVEIIINQYSFKLNVLTSLQEKAFKLISGSLKEQLSFHKVKSPMPGLVLKINKSIGDNVNRGETILVLEAMKMENEIKSPVEGKITDIFVKSGSVIEKNTLLFSIK